MYPSPKDGKHDYKAQNPTVQKAKLRTRSVKKYYSSIITCCESQ